MNLITTCSPFYYGTAKKLVDSFRIFYPDDMAIVYYFGGSAPNIGADEYIEIPKICEHAHLGTHFFFKTYAMWHAMNLGVPFIYLDSRHRFLSQPKEIESALQTKGRFFVQYPNSHIIVNRDTVRFNLKCVTTQKCFENMGCNEPRYKDALSYWAAIQAWIPTEEHVKFANEFLEHMKHPNIAGPSNKIWKPEPSNPECLCHRNDQSVLSILIEKYGWHQPYSDDIWMKYGDFHTIKTVEPNPIIIGRQLL